MCRRAGLLSQPRADPKGVSSFGILSDARYVSPPQRAGHGIIIRKPSINLAPFFETKSRPLSVFLLFGF